MPHSKLWLLLSLKSSMISMFLKSVVSFQCSYMNFSSICLSLLPEMFFHAFQNTTIPWFSSSFPDLSFLFSLLIFALLSDTFILGCYGAHVTIFSICAQALGMSFSCICFNYHLYAYDSQIYISSSELFSKLHTPITSSYYTSPLG